MRILHVITSLHIGGAERLMTILLPQLRDLGNDVELLVFDDTRTSFTEELERQEIKIHSLNASKVYSPLNIFRLRKYLKGFDIVHTHNTACQLFTPIALELMSGNKSLLITTEHSTSNRRRNKQWFRRIDMWMYKRYDCVICISDSTQYNLCDYLKCPVKTKIIYNGIEIKDVTSVTMPNKEREIIVSMVAAFRIGKDQDSLVKALSLLPSNYHVRFIGDGERRPEVEALVKELNLQDRVEFTGNRGDVNELLQDSHINVLSSHWEGFGLSAVEGMALGIPTIVSDVPGLREIVKGYGIVFQDSDYEALAKAIKSIVEDPKEYISVSQRCRKRAEEFDIALTAKKYNELYQSIIENEHS